MMLKKIRTFRRLFACLMIGFASQCVCAADSAKTLPQEQPAFELRESFSETMLHNMERIHAWEKQYDAFSPALEGVGIDAWYVLGPLKKDSPIIEKVVNDYQLIDLQTPLKDDQGSHSWQACPNFKDGEICDLTHYQAAGSEDAFILIRPIAVAEKNNVQSAKVDITLGAGYTQWHPGRNRRNEQRDWPMLDDNYKLQLRSAANQFMMVLRPDPTGLRRFYFQISTENQKSPVGHSWIRSSRRLDLARRTLVACSTTPEKKLISEWQAGVDIFVPGETYRYRYSWVPGCQSEFLTMGFNQASEVMMQTVKEKLALKEGILVQALLSHREQIETWLKEVQATKPAQTPAEAQSVYFNLCSVSELMTSAASAISMRLAVEDHIRMFGDRYPQGPVALKRIEDCRVEGEQLLRSLPKTDAELPIRVAKHVVARHALQQATLLDTPLLNFEKLLVALGQVNFNSNWGGANTIGDGLYTLSPVCPTGTLSCVHKGLISNYDLHWDGQRVLFSDRKALWELNLSATNNPPRQITDAPENVFHYDSCYLPDGNLLSVCNACYQGVPCTGEPNVGNLHLMDAQGGHERRIAFDQDHNWNPSVMNDGRVLYTRWEYTDTPHFFTRFLMRMNPDGSGQMEYYGSGSYWPNAMYWPRAIPKDPNQVVCIVSGHHGVSRVGEVMLLDPRKGRQEAHGVVQRLPGYGQTVEPVIMDRLISKVWPRYAAPYPLAEGADAIGAGRYFLVCRQMNAASGWDLCLIDIYDNVTTIKSAEIQDNGQFVNYMTPIPLQTRPMPPVIPSVLNPNQQDGTIYLSDIYRGDGLRGYPQGSIKALRIGTHHYRYFGNGATYSHAYEGGWDIKRILGTVPVNEDGSAFFRVPANTPIFIQPLDAEGKAQQQMRSWYTAMPGETASCIGCHEPQNTVPPVQPNTASRAKPTPITPWQGETRGFSFEHEIQPILNRRCVGCHHDKPFMKNGQPYKMEDFRDKRVQPYDPSLIPSKCSWWGWLGPANRHLKEQPHCYSPAYMRLQKYVRRVGLEADLHMHKPAEFDADTSELVQRLKKGHHGVRLTQNEWEALYTWIDFNVPYCGTWRESNLPPNEEHIRLRAEYKKRYANIDDRDEEIRPVPDICAFEPPPVCDKQPVVQIKIDGWPMSKDQAITAQKAAGETSLKLDLGEGVFMDFSHIPAGKFVMGRANGFSDEKPLCEVTIEQPFYLGTLEVTCAQYARFDPKHENGFIEGRNKDRDNRGYPINDTQDPVIRISWNEAMAFCAWLSRVSGRPCTLPSEAQWEWACRAGTDTDFAFGSELKNFKANLADEGLRDWNYGRAQTGYQDNVNYSASGGRFDPNAWGLFDMHGNVSEWTLSQYQPYPYKREATEEGILKVVRGGSWNDRLSFATSASRWRYPAFQPVYNVGFRVLIQK